MPKIDMRRGQVAARSRAAGVRKVAQQDGLPVVLRPHDRHVIRGGLRQVALDAPEERSSPQHGRNRRSEDLVRIRRHDRASASCLARATRALKSSFIRSHLAISGTDSR